MTPRSLKTPAVKLLVGTNPTEEFIVHQGLVCKHSEFFKAALKGSWRESEEKVVKFPEDEPELFEYWLELLYFNKPLADLKLREKSVMREEGVKRLSNIATTTPSKDLEIGRQFSESPYDRTPSENYWDLEKAARQKERDAKEASRKLKLNEEVTHKYFILSKLYVLCEKLMDTTTQTLIVNTIRTLSFSSYPSLDFNFYSSLDFSVCPSPDFRFYPSLDCVRIIYEGTTRDDDKCRRQMVSLYDEGDGTFFDDSVEDMPKAFLYDLAKYMFQHRPRDEGDVIEVLRERKDRTDCHSDTGEGESLSWYPLT